MRILLLGGRGQVGWELQRALSPLGDLTVLDRERNNGLCGDLEKPDELRRSLRRVNPDLIANAAAYTNVNKAEDEPERAERVNAEAPGVLAAEAARLDAWLVHYSTDYVFDGSGSDPWREDDSPAPRSIYGSTKWRGEQAIMDADCKHLIFRTQWVYAARGENFVRKMLRLASERDRLEVVADQHGAPTGAELIADVTAHAIRLAMERVEISGTYHLAARGETNWHAYASFIVDLARQAGWPVVLKNSAILPVTSDAVRGGAPRPLNSRLDITRMERTFGVRLPQWRDGVARAIAECTGG